MALPQGFNTLFDWYNQVTTDMNVNNMDIEVLTKFWSQLTVQQKTAVKSSFKSKIDQSITDLTAIKNHIDSL